LEETAAAATETTVAGATRTALSSTEFTANPVSVNPTTPVNTAPTGANTGPQLVGNVPSGNATVRTVYNSATQQIWVGTENQIFHAEVLGDAIQNGQWTLLGNTVDEQFVGGNATFKNGQLVQWDWISGHILGTPELHQAAENAASTIAGPK
jgi:hypothetical protein